MEILTVSDPDSVTFPLHKETWDDPDIFYHGSSRVVNMSTIFKYRSNRNQFPTLATSFLNWILSHLQYC